MKSIIEELFRFRGWLGDFYDQRVFHRTLMNFADDGLCVSRTGDRVSIVLIQTENERKRIAQSAEFELKDSIWTPVTHRSYFRGKRISETKEGTELLHRIRDFSETIKNSGFEIVLGYEISNHVYEFGGVEC